MRHPPEQDSHQPPAEAEAPPTRLERRIQELAETMERLQLTEYMRYLNDGWRLLWVNFLSGLSRGLGMAVGFTILGAVLIVFLQRITVENLPILGEFVADVVRVVQDSLGKH